MNYHRNINHKVTIDERVLILIKRNVKLNFYVGFLKYSHLEELKKEVIEAANFYQSFFILVVAVAFGPYRIRDWLW